MSYRVESDSMGEVRIPKKTLYGAQTQRAVDNFPVSGFRLPREMLRSINLLKAMAAVVNRELREIPEEMAKAIERAVREVAAGVYDSEFMVDIFQTGRTVQEVARETGFLPESELARAYLLATSPDR